jgi:hypothetical protein
MIKLTKKHPSSDASPVIWIARRYVERVELRGEDTTVYLVGGDTFRVLETVGDVVHQVIWGSRNETIHWRDGVEVAWGIIANAGVPQGDWTSMSQEWQNAAAKWRDTYMPALSSELAEEAQRGAV